MEVVKYYPLYTLEKLITQRSFNTHTPQRQIKEDICAILDISMNHLWRIRRAQIGEQGYLSTNDLIKLAHYFQVGIQDLINHHAASLAPTPTDTGSSPHGEDTGISAARSFSQITPSRPNVDEDGAFHHSPIHPATDETH